MRRITRGRRRNTCIGLRGRRRKRSWRRFRRIRSRSSIPVTCRRAAAAAVHDIILQLLNGLVVGASLALVASGLALVFGVLDIVNFAQGELFMLGGYVLFFTQQL